MSVTETYSKKRVQRAGRLLRDINTGRGGDVAPDVLFDAIDAVDWWRARHARPLARTNAGLRYYVNKVAPQSQTNVTQRLKRFATIVDRLDRHPNMQLTNMEDIAGVRAVLDTKAQIDALALRSTPAASLRQHRSRDSPTWARFAHALTLPAPTAVRREPDIKPTRTYALQSRRRERAGKRH